MLYKWYEKFSGARGAGTFLVEHMLTFRNFSTHLLCEWKNKKVPWYFSKFSRKTPHPLLFYEKFPFISFPSLKIFWNPMIFLIKKCHALFENFKKHPSTLWVLLGICSIKKVATPPGSFKLYVFIVAPRPISCSKFTVPITWNKFAVPISRTYYLISIYCTY